VHLDEKSPHMHLCFVPLTEDKRLCAKEILGNKKKLTQWQDKYWEHMVKKYPDLERGESASETGRDHIPTRVFKQMARLNKQHDKLAELLSDMKFTNYKERSAQIAAFLEKYIPDVAAMETQMKKYKIIYADPPWRYARSKAQGAAEKHYPTMSIEELCALPVKEIADKDCILFLWATFPQLKEALQLIKAWGFTYKSVAFVWLKQNRKSPTWFYGLGFWTRGNAEICLLATKGHPKRQSNKVHQFIISPVEQHSKKPDITREKILALMGDLPRIELFARQHTPGWDVWGNEIKSDIRFAGKEV